MLHNPNRAFHISSLEHLCNTPLIFSVCQKIIEIHKAMLSLVVESGQHLRHQPPP